MPAAWIEQSGLFHAGTAPGLYVVRATSNQDPTAYAEALVEVVMRGGPPPFPSWMEVIVREYRSSPSATPESP